jgi:hypothetical protein
MSINATLLLTGALGFTIAQAWNDAVNNAIRSYTLPNNGKNATKLSIIYAIVITLLVVIIVAVVNHTRQVVHSIIGGYQSRPIEQPAVTLWSPPPP